jgi:hypothetical protein
LLGLSLSSCCCFNPASVNCRVSQFATFHAAFASPEASSANWGFRFSRPNLHLLSLRPDDLLTILEDGFVDRFRKFGFSPLRYPSYKVLTFTLVGLSPTEHTSFSWTHFRTVGFPQSGFKASMSGGAYGILWLHASGTNPGSHSVHSPFRILSFCLPHRGIRSATSTSIDFGAIFPFTAVLACNPPCLRFAVAVTGHHARLGTRLRARLCRGLHFRRLNSLSFQGTTLPDPTAQIARSGFLRRYSPRPPRNT